MYARHFEHQFAVFACVEKVRGLQDRLGEGFARQIGHQRMVTKSGDRPVLIGSKPQALRRLGAAHDALEDLLARQDDPDRPSEFFRRNRRRDHFFADAQLGAEPAAHEARDQADTVFFHIQRIGQFADVVIQHLQRCVDSQLVAIPLRDCSMRLHRSRCVALGRVSHIDRMSRLGHGPGKIALPDRFVFLLFALDCLRVDRCALVLAIFDGKMLCRIACLFEGFRHDQRDWLAPIADSFRALLRRFVGRALCRAGGELGIVDQCKHTRHGEHRVPVHSRDLTACDRRCHQHAFGAALDRIFGGIGRGASHLRQAFDARDALAEHALLHAIEPIALVRLVLFEMDGHAASSAACSSTACNVRRARGILKSFSP